MKYLKIFWKGLRNAVDQRQISALGVVTALGALSFSPNWFVTAVLIWSLVCFAAGYAGPTHDKESEDGME